MHKKTFTQGFREEIYDIEDKDNKDVNNKGDNAGKGFSPLKLARDLGTGAQTGK